MGILKTIFKTLGNLLDVIGFSLVAIFIILLVAGNATIGCNQGWFSKAISCAATVTLPLR